MDLKTIGFIAELSDVTGTIECLVGDIEDQVGSGSEDELVNMIVSGSNIQLIESAKALTERIMAIRQGLHLGFPREADLLARCDILLSKARSVVAQD